MGNMHRKLGEVWTCGFRDKLMRGDSQSVRETWFITILYSTSGGGIIKKHRYVTYNDDNDDAPIVAKQSVVSSIDRPEILPPKYHCKVSLLIRTPPPFN